MSVVDFYLRTMQESDLPSVLQIETRAYEFPWSQKGFENALDQGLNFVMCHPQNEQEIWGYVCFLTVLDEATLMNLCVAPEYQGQGLAKQVLELTIQKLQSSGFNVIYLEVRESNRPARNLYASFGFAEDGIRKNYYPAWQMVDGKKAKVQEDAVLMSKQIC